jgi:putative ABC transport system permease protein
MLRVRPGGMVASFIALFLGAAVVMVGGGLMETGIRADVPPQRLAGASVIVNGRQEFDGQPLAERSRLDAGLVDRLAALPGVAAAVPDISVPSALMSGSAGSAQSTGHGWSSAALGPYRLTAGHAPTGPREVVLDSALAAHAGALPGSTIRVQAPAGLDTFQVVGTVAATPNLPSALFFTDTEAQALLGRPGQVDSVALRTRPGADPARVAAQVRALIPGVDVLTGDARGRAEFPEAAPAKTVVISVAGALGGLAACVVVFVVASTTGLSIQLRLREMALLRAIGTSPRQLRRMIIGETLAVAIPATLLGFPPSGWLGRKVLHSLVNAGVVPPQMVFHEGWIPEVGGLALGLLTALGAALIAARTATRVRPTEALSESALPKRWLSVTRLVFALLFLSGAVALSLVTWLAIPVPEAAATAYPGAILWAAGLALLGPGLTRVLTAVLRRPIAALSGKSGHLAMLNAEARKIRLASAVTSIMLATGVAMALIFLQNAVTNETERIYAGGLRADAVLTSADGGLPIGLADRVAALPGVAGASALVTSSGFFEPAAPLTHGDVKPVPLSGITAADAAATTSYTVTSGRLADLTGNTVALAGAYVHPGQSLGDSVRMRLGDDTVVSLRIVAVFSAPAGFETALLPAQLLAEHTSFGLADQILVRAAPGVSVASLTHTLAGAMADQPGARVADRAGVTAAFARQQQAQKWMTTLFVGGISGYTVISLVNTLVIATGNRRREFALQRLIGSTRGQVLRMLGVESAFVATAGMLLGTAIAVLSVTTRFPVSTWGPAWIYPAVAASAFGLTLLSSLIAAGVALRGRPIVVASTQIN